MYIYGVVGTKPQFPLKTGHVELPRASAPWKRVAFFFFFPGGGRAPPGGGFFIAAVPPAPSKRKSTAVILSCAQVIIGKNVIHMGRAIENEEDGAEPDDKVDTHDASGHRRHPEVCRGRSQHAWGWRTALRQSSRPRTIVRAALVKRGRDLAGDRQLQRLPYGARRQGFCRRFSGFRTWSAH